MSLSKQIGERVRSFRKAKGLSQEELAEHASVHYTYIGQVERGEKNFSLDTLERVINALDITFEELFRFLPGNNNNIEESQLELLINRIQERKPKDREAILKIFHELLDWKEH
jgi:transcriptional regulator with XRE-family HTH domain